MSIHQQKLLRVTAPHFVAGSVWEFHHGWQCIRAAPIIKWMIGKHPTEVKNYLIKKKWDYQWL